MSADVFHDGRFLVAITPKPSPLARSGHLYAWGVTDFDNGAEFSGLADSPTSARAEALTVMKRECAS